MKIKVSEATPLQLDWMVAKCDIKRAVLHDDGITRCIMLKTAKGLYAGRFNPSTDWAQGGPIIEREGISIVRDEGYGYWQAVTDANSGSMFGPGLCGNNFQHGPTPLIAAMRCYVVSKLGDKVDVPEELK